MSIAHLQDGIKAYLSKDFRADLIAGTVVGLIALPLAIAFAVASGARPEQGIYTSIIAGIVVGILSGSRFQITGPTGAFVVILLNVVNLHGINGLMVAGFMAGVILLVMGLGRFGSVIRYIPYPVTVGFTAGIGVIIFSGQIKDFLGLGFPHRPHDFIETLELIGRGLSEGVNLSALVVGGTTIFTYIVWRRRSTLVPPAPVALAVGIITSLILRLAPPDLFQAAATVGSIPTGLPSFAMPAFSWELVQQMVPAAFTIAMLGAIESLLSAVVADGMAGTKHDSNRELMAQGVGNMVLPFFGGIPATGAIARTAANIRNGARTRMSSVIHALVLLAILLVAAPAAKYIPLAALAAILMMVAVNMSEIPHFMHLLKSPKQDAAVLITTFLLTVFADLTVAVGIGIGMAAVLFIQRVSTLTVLESPEQIEGTDVGGSDRLRESLQGFPEIVLYKVAGPLFFGVATEFENRIRHNRGEVLILRMKFVSHMDASGIHALEMIVNRVLGQDGIIYLSTLQPRIRAKLDRVGLIEKIGGERHVPETSVAAIEDAKKVIVARRMTVPLR
jgi:SulP family sulfate permease